MTDTNTRNTPAIAITYCGGCGYEAQAMRLATDIGREFAIPVTLFKTVGGVFEVDIEEERIFSKIKLGRFPKDGEVLHILKRKFESSQEPNSLFHAQISPSLET